MLKIDSTHSLLVLAIPADDQTPRILFGCPLSGGRLSVKGFHPFRRGERLSVQLCYWNGNREVDALVVEMETVPGGWEGVLEVA